MRTFVFASIIIALLAGASSCNPGDTSQATVNARGVEVPAIEPGCLDGHCVEGQWVTTYNRFAVVAGDGLKMRARPSVSSRIMEQLPLTKKITVLYRQPREANVEGVTGRWAYIRHADDINNTGWVLDYYVCFKDSFVKVTNWRIREIRLILGSSVYIYTCTPDGRFSMVTEGPRKDGTAEGDIMQFRNVIWLRKETPDDYPAFFQLLENGKLDMQEQYRKRGRIIVK